MTLQVATQPNSATATSVTFVVPGHQQWWLKSVRIDVTRAAGGIPTRAYLLEITDGTTDVAQNGAADAGTEPGAASVTWCDAASSVTAAGPIGIVVAPVAQLVLTKGYVLTASIVNPAVGDLITASAAWYDFVYAS